MFNVSQYARVAREFLTLKKAEGFSPHVWNSDVLIYGTCYGWAEENGLTAEYEAFQDERLGPEKARATLHIDVEKTRRYYAEQKPEDYCDCEGCKNFRALARSAHPELAEYLDSLGVDIRWPFENTSVELENGTSLYGGWYLAFGEGDCAWSKTLGDVVLLPGLLHPEHGLQGDDVLTLNFENLILPTP